MKLTRKKILVTKNEEKERKTEEVLMEQTHKKHLGSSNQANQDIKCLVHFLCVCRDFFFCVNATRCCYYCSLNRNKQWIPKCGDNKKNGKEYLKTNHWQKDIETLEGALLVASR